MDSVFELTAATRFQESALNLFTVSELTTLIRLSPGAEAPSDKLRKLLTDSGIGKQGLNAAEIMMVSKLCTRASLGVRVFGSPYEEKTIPKSGSVSYTPTEIILTTKNSEVTKIANHPLPPSETPKRRGEAKLAQVCYSLYDISKGELVRIRDAKLDHDWYSNPATNYAPEGVDLLIQQVRTQLMKYKPYTKLFEDKKETYTGHLACDFWYGFASWLSDQDLIGLHYCMMKHLIKQISLRADAKTGLIRPHSVSIPSKDEGRPATIPVPAATFIRSSLAGAAEFRTKTSVDAIIWDKPIAPVAVMIAVKSAVDLLTLQKSMTTLIGGKSRGIGMVASWSDYCPRQSETIRRMNWFLMAISNAKSKQVDVHVRPGDLTLMNIHIAARKAAGDFMYADIRLVISMDNTKGQIRKDYYSVGMRPDVVQIAILDWLTIPDVVPGIKKQKDNDEAINARYSEFAAHIKTFGLRYIIQAPVFHPKAFLAYEVSGNTITPNLFRHGRGHDLQMTHSTVSKTLHSPSGADWLQPTTWIDFCAAAREAFRYFAGWHLCGEMTYNHLGTWFAPSVSNVEVVDGEWKFSEFVPTLAAPVVGGAVVDDDIPDEVISIAPVRSSISGNSSNTAAISSVRNTVAPPVIPDPQFAPDQIPEEEEPQGIVS